VPNRLEAINTIISAPTSGEETKTEIEVGGTKYAIVRSQLFPSPIDGTEGTIAVLLTLFE
jgi:hypothetical protein